jgi:hypothetical protein
VMCCHSFEYNGVMIRLLVLHTHSKEGHRELLNIQEEGKQQQKKTRTNPKSQARDGGAAVR